MFNPPYVPTPDDELARGGLAAAWAGGARGRRVIDRLLPAVPALLSDRGEMFMVAVHENEPAGGRALLACGTCAGVAGAGRSGGLPGIVAATGAPRKLLPLPHHSTVDLALPPQN